MRRDRRPSRDQRDREDRRWGPTHLGGPLLLLLLLLIVLLLGGCALVNSTAPSAFPEAPAQIAATLPHVAHRGPVLVDVCAQVVPKYSRDLFASATALVAQSVEAMAQANSDGGVVYLNLVDNDPARPSNTPLVLTIPPTPPYPAAPSLTPTPTTSASNPYGSAQAQATVARWNQQASQAYLDQLTSAEDVLAQVQAQVRAWTKQVRALRPPPGRGPAELGQCVQVASQRFNNWQAEKYLVIAGDVTDPAQNASWYSLAGVHMRWIFAGCSDVESCQAGENAWMQALSRAGIRDVLFFDPGESRALSNVFGTPANHP